MKDVLETTFLSIIILLLRNGCEMYTHAMSWYMYIVCSEDSHLVLDNFVMELEGSDI